MNQGCVYRGQVTLSEVLATMESNKTKISLAFKKAIVNDFQLSAVCLIRSGASINSPVCRDDLSLPIHLATKNGSYLLVKELIDAGCNVNTANTKSESAVHIAVGSQCPEILQELVDKGCDVNLPDQMSNATPLHLAVKFAKSTETFLKILNILLYGGCNLNSVAYNTLETPLYSAINIDMTDISQILLIHGASPNISAPFDVTALQKATNRRNNKLVKLLCRCQIDWSREKRWLPNGLIVARSNNGDIYFDLVRYIQEWRTSVHTLEELCRMSIRGYVRHPTGLNILHLKLPQKLLGYLNFSDLL